MGLRSIPDKPISKIPIKPEGIACSVRLIWRLSTPASTGSRIIPQGEESETLVCRPRATDFGPTAWNLSDQA